jgi:4-amino-4-deoxy-L-arabinose transferase-like glycosyltransferase
MAGGPEERRRIRDLAVILAGAVAVRMLALTGPSDSDSLAYSEIAANLMIDGWPERDSIMNMRVGFVAAVALSYAILGVSALSLALPSLVSSLVLVGLAYRLGERTSGRPAGIAAAAVLACDPRDIFFATEGHTDLAMAMFTGMAFLRLLAGDPEGRAGPRNCLMAGFLFGAAHLFKEMAVLAVVCACVLLLERKASRREILLLLGGYLSVLALEGAVYGIVRGNPFHRFVSTLHLQRGQMFLDQHLEYAPTLRRVFLDVPSALFNPLDRDFAYTGLHAWAFVAAGVTFFRARPLRPFLYWWIGLVVLINFWPVSVVPFRPAIIASPWVFTSLSLPAAVVIGEGAVRLWTRSRAAAGAAGGLLAATAAVGLWVLESDVRSAREPVREALTGLSRDAVLVSDPRTARLVDFCRGYQGSVKTWGDALPAGTWYYLEHPFWYEMQARLYGVHPPRGIGEAVAQGRLVREASAPGRIRLRGLLRGRLERSSPNLARLYEIGRAPP